MLLSDKLILIGVSSNPRNNLSMANALEEMKKEISQARKSHTPKQLYNIAIFVCEQLNKMGWTKFDCERMLS